MKINKAKQSILVITTGFIVLYFIFKKFAFLFIAGGIFLPGISSQWMAKMIHWAWMKLAHILGTINSYILLTIVYYLVVTPIGFLMRIAGKSQVQLKPPSSKSTFISRDHLFTKTDLENPW